MWKVGKVKSVHVPVHLSSCPSVSICPCSCLSVPQVPCLCGAVQPCWTVPVSSSVTEGGDKGGGAASVLSGIFSFDP